MPMIDSQPLAEQLARVDAANARWDALLDASGGQHATDTNAEHIERMRKIDEAEQDYHYELGALRAQVQLAIEQAEGKR